MGKQWLVNFTFDHLLLPLPQLLKMNLSAVIITFNEERNIGRCLDSLAGVADEVVVVDSFSTDRTAEICREKGARCVQHAFTGHIEQKNYALTQAAFDHVLSLDADEALSDTLRQSILTAKAKGLPFRQVVWKHAFRNALFPLITLFASVFPATVAGSFVIEYVFNINGMGRLLVANTQQMDWPVVFALIMLSAMLTMLGNFIADLLYKWADPRVKWR